MLSLDVYVQVVMPLGSELPYDLKSRPELPPARVANRGLSCRLIIALADLSDAEDVPMTQSKFLLEVRSFYTKV